MKRQVWILGGLLGVALVLSYVSWTQKEVAIPGDRTVVLQVKPDELDAIRFVETSAGKKDPKKDAAKKDAKEEAKDDAPVSETPPDTKVVELAAHRDALGRWWSITVTQGEKRQVFTGGRSVDRALDDLAPLVAYRVLDDVPESGLEKLGLKDPKATLELVRGGRTWRFAIGGASWGTERRYLRPEGKNVVWLVGGGAFNLLERADTALVEREPLGLERRDIDRVAVSSATKKIEIVQHNRDDRRKAYWAAAATPDKKSDLFENWIDKVFRLRVESYVEDAKTPSGLEPVVHLDIDSSDGEVPFDLLSLQTKDGKTDYYARSGHTRALVKLRAATAGEVAADVGSVLAAGG